MKSTLMYVGNTFSKDESVKAMMSVKRKISGT